MSIKQFPGGIITKNPTAPAGPYETSAAPGIWTLDQAMNYKKQGIWPTAGNIAPGQQAYTTAGTYSWVAPAGISSVSVVVVGGAAGRGGALAYKNNYTVVSGNSYSLRVQAAGGCGCTASFFNTTCTVRAGSGANRVGDGGGNGGLQGDGGAGAGGYSGQGGTGQSPCCGIAATNGAGGGGAGGTVSSFIGGGGGGVGILGQGASGVINANGRGGGGGSGGANGGCAGGGGAYGGGAGSLLPAGGAVRIIWPGTTRSFPSTCTGNL